MGLRSNWYCAFLSHIRRIREHIIWYFFLTTKTLWKLCSEPDFLIFSCGRELLNSPCLWRRWEVCQGQARSQAQIKIILRVAKSKTQTEWERKLGKERPSGTFQKTRLVSDSAVYIGMLVCDQKSCWAMGKCCLTYFPHLPCFSPLVLPTSSFLVWGLSLVNHVFSYIDKEIFWKAQGSVIL